MKHIPAHEVNGCLAPAEPIPATALRVVCDGENYIVYEEGDALPPDPIPAPDSVPAA